MKLYPCILADPPWSYDGKVPSRGKPNAFNRYSVMITDDICGMIHVEAGGEWAIAGYGVADTAILWLWVTNPFLVNGDGPRVCRAWGFEPKQLITWVKGRLEVVYPADVESEDPTAKLVLNIGMGRPTRNCTEHIIVATRGKVSSLITDKGVANMFLSSRGEHSVKPDLVYEIIERIQGEGPRLELFSRRRRPGWDSMGNQLPPLCKCGCGKSGPMELIHPEDYQGERG